MACGTQEKTAAVCPLCGRLYCAVCYPAHRKIMGKELDLVLSENIINKAAKVTDRAKK